MNSKTELFLNKYRELEALIASEFSLLNNESPVPFLLRKPEYRNIKAELDYCREVRNLLTHNPKLNGRFPVEPSDEMIELLGKTIEKIRNPQRAKHIFIPKESVFCRTLEDYVLPTMVEMNAHIYTHIPIIHNGIVVGVFSENTLLSYLIDEELVCIDGNMKFSDISRYLPFDQHKAESFRFVSKDTLVSEITGMFAEAISKNDRIGLIFVTNNGKPTEKVLGILSAWDVAGAK